MSQDNNNSSQRFVPYRAVLPFYILYDLDLNANHFRLYGQIEQMESNPDPSVSAGFSYTWFSKQLGIDRSNAIRTANVLKKKGYIEHLEISSGKWIWRIVRKPIIHQSEVLTLTEAAEAKSVLSPVAPSATPSGAQCDPPSGAQCDLKIPEININSLSLENFPLEQNLYTESEQQKKACHFRKECLINQKCLDKYEELPSLVRKDKSFEEVLDECVSYYGTQSKPQLVSPQRLLTWINREINYHKKTALVKETSSKKPKYDDHDTSWIHKKSIFD